MILTAILPLSNRWIYWQHSWDVSSWQAMHCVRFPCAWIMDKLISKWAKEEQPATTNILTDSVYQDTIKPHIKPWRFFSASLYLKRHSLYQCAAWPCELLQVGAVWPAALCMTANAKTLPTPMPTDLTGFLLRWQDIVLPSTAVGVKVFTWNIRGARLRAKRSGSPDTTRLLRFSRRTLPRSSFAPPTIPSPTSSCRNRQVILCEKKKEKKKWQTRGPVSAGGTNWSRKNTALKRKAHIKLKRTQGSERLSPPPPQWRRMAEEPGTGAPVDKSLPTCRFTMLGWIDKCVKRGVCQSPWRGGPHTDAGQ